MDLKERIQTFDVLGKVLRDIGHNKDWTDYGNGITLSEHEKLNDLVKNVFNYNGWFTEEMVRKAMLAIGESLHKEDVGKWLGGYNEESLNRDNPNKIAVIMAGNIPLVGFHDFLCILISGDIFLGKCSSKDDKLLRGITEILFFINPSFKNRVIFTDGKIEGMNAVIATGSNNSNRYFDYYFSNYPSVLRKNRNSVAILEGNETERDLANLGNDFLDYYGLGCRNVSKIFLPKGYDLNKIIKQIYSKKTVLEHNKYTNNYDYQKALYLMSQTELLENGFLLFKEDTELSSPIATVFYEFYDDLGVLESNLEANKEKIQCIVSNKHVPFGEAQKPKLWDYADNVDTVEFLLSIR